MRQHLIFLGCALACLAGEGTASCADTLPQANGDSQRARLEVQVPDARGLLYVDGQRIEPRGAHYSLRTPPLEAGEAYYYHLRAAFRSGERLVIQDRKIEVHAGQAVSITFDGKNALSVPLPGEIEQAPPPRVLPPTDAGLR
jgi:uncharacterized protein (TIGR03000 family)